MPIASTQKITEQQLKKSVACWFEGQGLRHYYQEFEFIRRPDLLAIDFDNDQSSVLWKVFSRIPFDYLCLNFTKKRFSPEDIVDRFGLSIGILKRDLATLLNHGYLAKSNAGYRVVRTDSFLTRLVTVECKVKDWKQGLKQAITYKTLFSRESYLAIPKVHVSGIRLEEFQCTGIGLLSVDASGNVQEVLSPKGDKVRSYYTHSASASILNSFHARSLKKV